MAADFAAARGDRSAGICAAREACTIPRICFAEGIRFPARPQTNGRAGWSRRLRERRKLPRAGSGVNPPLLSFDWQAGEADASGMHFVANVEANQQRSDGLDDARVFEFSAVERAGAGDFCGEFASNAF